MEGDAPFFKYVVMNNGTGPAIIEYAKVTDATGSVKTWRELLDRQNITGSQFVQSHIGGGVIPATKTVEPFVTSHPETIQSMLKVGNKFSVELCYCSIYQECWILGTSNQPKEVQVCKVKKEEAFTQ